MATSLKRLTEEHERLQNEYSKLRQQFIEVSSMTGQGRGRDRDTSSSSSTPPASLIVLSSCNDPECGLTDRVKSLSKLADNYKNEIIRLQEEVRRVQRTLVEARSINLMSCVGESNSSMSMAERESHSLMITQQEKGGMFV